MSMKTAKRITLIGMGVMLIAFIYGFIAGDILGDASSVLGVPWGQVAMVDLSVGFLLFDAWIAYRERSLGRAILWIALVSTMGFFMASLYAYLALNASDGDWAAFWMGRHAPTGS